MSTAVDLPTLGVLLAMCISTTESLLIQPFGSLVLLFGLHDEAYNCVLCYATENDQEEIFTQEKDTPPSEQRSHNTKTG